MRFIYTCGDSHAGMFGSTSIEGVQFPDLLGHTMGGPGPFTAYSLYEHNLEIQEALFKIPEHSSIWFVYGEIDVRYRIFAHHRDDDTPLDIVIDNVVNSYIGYLCTLKDRFDIGVVSVVPPHRVFPNDNHQAEYEGTNEDRRYITEVFNAKLKYACHKQGIKFIDMYHYLVDPVDGMNRREMLFYEGHYAPLNSLLTNELSYLWKE